MENPLLNIINVVNAWAIDHIVTEVSGLTKGGAWKNPWKLHFSKLDDALSTSFQPELLHQWLSTKKYLEWNNWFQVEYYLKQAPKLAKNPKHESR